MATKTYAQLTTASDVQDNDLLATYRGTGPLKAILASVLATYVGTKLASLFVPVARTITGAGLATGGGDLSANRTITVTEALAADVLTGTTTAKVMTPGDTYGALAEVALFTNGSNVLVTGSTSGTTLDMSTFLDAEVVLGSNVTLPNPTTPKVGQTGMIRIIQDATGGRTLSYGSNWKRQGGAGSLSSTANATDLLSYRVVTSTYVVYDIIKSPS